MMTSEKIKIGVAATRRNVFSKEEAKRYKELILKYLGNFDVDIVDIDDVNDEGLLFDESGAQQTIEKFVKNQVDGVFFPHCNFGTEHLVGRVGQALGKPVLLWGPQDDSPDANGQRTRDTQCGLFVSGKALRRFNVPFTYIVNCRLEDQAFRSGLETFISVCRVVKAFRRLRILQIAPRPQAFWSVMANEGELFEKFGIEVVPITLSELIVKINKVIKQGSEEFKQFHNIIDSYQKDLPGGNETINKIAGLRLAMKDLCDDFGCSAVCIQCWDALQEELAIYPCFANALLTDEKIPVICETDIHGAVSAILLQSAINNTIFFSDMTIRHPDKPNTELLWHCGNFPISLARYPKNVSLKCHMNNPGCPGTGEFELKSGDLTVCRFDGDHGQYSLFIGEGHTTDGPKTKGTYVWMQVDDLDKWEHKLVTGPYVHHCAAGYGHVAHILYESCKYIAGLNPDPVSPSQADIERILLKGVR